MMNRKKKSLRYLALLLLTAILTANTPSFTHSTSSIILLTHSSHEVLAQEKPSSEEIEEIEIEIEGADPEKVVKEKKTEEKTEKTKENFNFFEWLLSLFFGKKDQELSFINANNLVRENYEPQPEQTKEPIEQPKELERQPKEDKKSSNIAGKFVLDPSLNSSKFTRAENAEDYGFNPDEARLTKIIKGSEIAYLNTGGKTLTYKPNDRTQGTINPSEIFSEEYLKNPLNIMSLLSSISEGHGSFNGRVFVFDPGVTFHKDPGSNLGEYQFNTGPFSGQHTPNTGAHKNIVALVGSSSGENSKIEVFKTSYWQDGALEYIPQMVRSFKKHDIWDKDLPIPFFIAALDCMVQFGGGKGGPVTDFVANHKSFEDWNKTQIQNWLNDKGYGLEYRVGGITRSINTLDLATLRVFLARLALFHNDEARWKGMARVARTNNVSFRQQCAYDQLRRVQTTQDLANLESLTKLSQAKISAFSY